MIPADGCLVWWATPAMYRAGHLELLSPTERARWQALRREPDRVRFALAAATLRLACAAVLDTRPTEVPVHRACPDCGKPHGRPELPGIGMHVSVSHSGERVAVALTWLAPVGLDVEEIGAVDVRALSDSVLGPGESAADRGQFYVYWTRKEAVIKATGSGLRCEKYWSAPPKPRLAYTPTHAGRDS